VGATTVTKQLIQSDELAGVGPEGFVFLVQNVSGVTCLVGDGNAAKHPINKATGATYAAYRALGMAPISRVGCQRYH
jgi:hypothetical protein